MWLIGSRFLSQSCPLKKVTELSISWLFDASSIPTVTNSVYASAPFESVLFLRSNSLTVDVDLNLLTALSTHFCESTNLNGTSVVNSSVVLQSLALVASASLFSTVNVPSSTDLSTSNRFDDSAVSEATSGVDSSSHFETITLIRSDLVPESGSMKTVTELLISRQFDELTQFSNSWQLKSVQFLPSFSVLLSADLTFLTEVFDSKHLTASSNVCTTSIPGVQSWLAATQTVAAALPFKPSANPLVYSARRNATAAPVDVGEQTSQPAIARAITAQTVAIIASFGSLFLLVLLLMLFLVFRRRSKTELSSDPDELPALPSLTTDIYDTDVFGEYENMNETHAGDGRLEWSSADTSISIEETVVVS
jgi:hypothetical protein